MKKYIQLIPIIMQIMKSREDQDTFLPEFPITFGGSLIKTSHYGNIEN